MTSPVYGTEGMLTMRLELDAGRITAVDVGSTRPLGVARIFLGKPVGEVLATLPLLYSVCATAQAAAAVAAVEAALYIHPSEPQRRAREAMLLAETAREHLVRCLLGWGAWLGERPDPRALALTGRLRGELAMALYPESDGFRPGGGRLLPNQVQLAKVLDSLELVLTGVVLGVPPQTWLEIGDATGLARVGRRGPLHGRPDPGPGRRSGLVGPRVLGRTPPGGDDRGRAGALAHGPSGRHLHQPNPPGTGSHGRPAPWPGRSIGP